MMQRRNTLNNNKGFTLIEIALAMLIIGLIMTPILALYNAEFDQTQINTTRGTFSSVDASLASFVNVNRRYPLPARLTDDEEDATYGQSVAIGAVGLCTGGIGIGVCSTGGANPILIGAVPFSDLQIEEDQMYDVWGQKIFYAVTLSQTNAGTYVPSGGGRILISALHTVTGAIVSPLPGYNNMDVVLVSTGPSGKGGYNAAGNLVDVCFDAANPEFEDENCDLDNVFMIDRNRSPGIVNDNNDGTRNLADGPRFYDDLTREILDIPPGIWNVNYGDPENIITSSRRLGIGEESPIAALHVKGDIRAGDGMTPGRILTDSVSDAAGLSMDPELIGGDVGDMNCEDNNTMQGLEPVVGIGNGRVFCATNSDASGVTPAFSQSRFDTTVVPPYPVGAGAFAPTTCTTGERIKSINPGGNPICATP